jgi:ABC-type lipoprotein release transport system permease subunit
VSKVQKPMSFIISCSSGLFPSKSASRIKEVGIM